MGGIGIGIVLFVIMAPFTGMLILIGYRIGIKYDYMMYSNYYKKKERYPIEIEQKYLRHTGVPILMMGISWLLFPFIYAFAYTTRHYWCIKVTIAVTVLTIAYLFIVPVYIAKRELKNLI